MGEIPSSLKYVTWVISPWPVTSSFHLIHLLISTGLSLLYVKFGCVKTNWSAVGSVFIRLNCLLLKEYFLSSVPTVIVCSAPVSHAYRLSPTDSPFTWLYVFQSTLSILIFLFWGLETVQRYTSGLLPVLFKFWRGMQPIRAVTEPPLMAMVSQEPSLP